VPRAAAIGFLVNPKDPTSEAATKDAQAAADALGHKLVIVNASSASEIEPAFAALVQRKISAVFVNADPLYNVNSPKIVALADRHRLLTVTSWEGFAADGGLISYGTSINEANRQLGVYTGRVLKGTRPGDLPVVQSTKFHMAINLKTAKRLRLTIPPSLLLRADTVIE
jgi:putative ABC transport system substrate-binding protein